MKDKINPDKKEQMNPTSEEDKKLVVLTEEEQAAIEFGRNTMLFD